MIFRVLDNDGFRDFEPGDVTPDDRGLLLGDGVFETFRVGDAGIRRSMDHRDRLARACQALDLPMPDWTQIDREAKRLSANAHNTGRLTITRGAGPRGLGSFKNIEPRVWLSLSEWAPPPLSLRLHMSGLCRSRRSLTTQHKTLSYADNAAARRGAENAGFDMALCLTDAGDVSGADCANIFAIQGDQLLTPSEACAIRSGVTRKAVIDLAKQSGLSVEEGGFAPDRFFQCEAVMVTNSAMGVVPVSQIDGHMFDVDQSTLSALKDAEAR